MPHLAVSSWALHRTIGTSFPDSPALGRRPAEVHGRGEGIPLLHVPSALARRGYSEMQLCHFHLPSRQTADLVEFRNALHDAGVELHALLVDDGDITNPDTGDRDADWIRGWLDVAMELGAKHARVIAGRQTFDEVTFARSVHHLCAFADHVGNALRIEVENWHELLATPESVHRLLDALEGRVGLCADWGNWPRPMKYAALPLILPRAETIHAKMDFIQADHLDEEDAATMIGQSTAAKFQGTYVLVNGGVGESEWDALELQRDALRLSGALDG